MDISGFGQSFAGRETEVKSLKSTLEAAVNGIGAAVIVSGEAGIGKSRLLEELRAHASDLNVKVLSGVAPRDSALPFQIFSKALDENLFQDQEYTTFTSIFAVNRVGMLVAQSSPGGAESDMDPDIFAGMLSAVQNFVKDSFESSGQGDVGLGRLEYGNMKIIIKHGEHLFLTAVLEGVEHPDMSGMLSNVVLEIEKEHGHILDKWSGSMNKVRGIQHSIDKVISTHFLVRRALDGLKLEAERVRIANSILERLAAMGRDAPVLLFLEDLHLADESSMFVFNYITRNIGRERMMIVGSLRPSENGALNTVIGKMQAEGIVSVMALGKLDELSTSDLINGLLEPNDFSEEFIDKFASQCEGNPFFMIEMLRHMVSDGSIGMKEGRYSLLNPEYTTAANVEDVVQKRLEALEPETMTMVEYVSCIGQHFDIDTALALEQARDASSAIDKLVEIGLLVRANGGVHFSHGIVQEVTYGSIGERWKQVYHKNIGEHYEKSHPVPGDNILYELARHFSKSNEHQKTFKYCISAGERAEASFAAEQAVRFYKSALKVLNHRGVANGGEEADIQSRLGDMLSLLGEYEPAMENYSNAANLCEPASEKRASVLRKRAIVYEKMGDYKQSVRELELAAVEIQNTGMAELGSIMVMKAAMIARMGDYTGAIDLAQRGIEVLSRFDEKVVGREVVRALNIIGVCSRIKGEIQKALDYHQEARVISEKLGFISGMSAALCGQGAVYFNTGKSEMALPFYMEDLELTQKVGDQWGLGIAYMNIGNAHLQNKDWPKVLEYYSKSLAIRRRIGDKAGIAMTLNNIGFVHFNKNEWDLALEKYLEAAGLHEATKDIGGLVSTLNNIGEAYWKKGDITKALVYIEKALTISRESGNKRMIAIAMLTKGQVLADSGKTLEAKEWFTEARELFTELGIAQRADECTLALHTLGKSAD